MRVSSLVGLALATLSWLAATALFIGTARAQQANPTQIAPQLRPAPTPGVSIGGAPVEPIVAPAGSDKVFVTVRQVLVEGAFPELQEQTAVLLAEIQGRRVSVARIYEFAKVLEAAYTASFPLARVKVPPQNFHSGVVRIDVIDGFIESLDLDKVPERARPQVLGRLEPLVGPRHLTRAAIQRRILLLNDISGLVGATSGRAGAQPGGTVLIVQAVDKWVTAAKVVDNRLSKYLGTWEFTDTAAINNALGYGEQFYGTVASSSDFGRFFEGKAKYEAFGAGVQAPLGFDGLKGEAGYIKVLQTPTPLDGTFAFPLSFAGERTTSPFDRAYVSVLYPLILTVPQTLRIQASYNYTQQRLYQYPFPAGFALPVGWVYDLYRDRYSAFRLAAEWSVQFPWDWGGSALSTAIYSHGLGGRTAWDSPLVGTGLSRPGASPAFDRLYVDTRIAQPLPGELDGLLIVRAQTSFGASLMLPEQFSLDGVNALSGFAAGTINVDRGVTVRGEFSKSFNFDVGFGQSSASPYLFGAWGLGVREWPYIGEIGRVEAESFGAGLRATTAITGLPFGEAFSIEFARSSSNLLYRPNGYRTNVTFLVKF
jgi:hemolysin activation/secretion protein